MRKVSVTMGAEESWRAFICLPDLALINRSMQIPDDASLKKNFLKEPPGMEHKAEYKGI